MKKIFLVFCWLNLLAVGASFASEKPVLAGNFTLPDLDGNSVQLADFRSKWVIVNYWATWCAPCRKEIPELSELHSERADIVVLGLSYEDIERSKLDKFMQEIHISYPVLELDTYDMPEFVDVPRALPMTIIVDPEGYRVRTFYGPITRAEIERVTGPGPVAEKIK